MTIKQEIKKLNVEELRHLLMHVVSPGRVPGNCEHKVRKQLEATAKRIGWNNIVNDLKDCRKGQLEFLRKSNSKHEICWDCRIIARKLGVENE